MSRSPKNSREKVGRFITILKRGRTYYAEICMDGAQSRRALGTRNLKVAREQALELDAELQRGNRPRKPKHVSLQVAIDSYLDYVKSEGRRLTTLEKYRSSLTCFRKYASAQKTVCLGQVNLLVLENYRAWLRKAGYSDATVEQSTILVKQLAKWAVKRELLANYTLGAVKGQKAEASRQACYTLEQVETILSVARGQLHSILEVLAFTGMRIGELVWLTWEDIDFEKGFVQVRPKENWRPKNGRPRAIPMHDRVRAVLRQLPRKHRWVFTAEPSKKYPQGGHRISKVHTLEKLKKLLGRLGLEGHLHAFRHFFASHCANNGVPPFQLVKWLGHADVSMVMHYYKLHDEESLWTMKQLSLAEGKKPQAASRAEAV